MAAERVDPGSGFRVFGAVGRPDSIIKKTRNPHTEIKDLQPAVTKEWFLVPKSVDNGHPYPPIGTPL